MLGLRFFRGRVERQAVSSPARSAISSWPRAPRSPAWPAARPGGARSRRGRHPRTVSRIRTANCIARGFDAPMSGALFSAHPMPCHRALVCLAIPLVLSSRLALAAGMPQAELATSEPVGSTQTVATRDSNDVEEQSDYGAAGRPSHGSCRAGQPSLDPEGGHGTGCCRRPGAALRAQRLFLIGRAELVHLGGLCAPAADRPLPGRYRHQAQRDQLLLQ